jgi:hypothetical protein
MIVSDLLYLRQIWAKGSESDDARRQADRKKQHGQVFVLSVRKYFYIIEVNGQTHQFPVSLEDIGGATFTGEFKAITLMRYIRKALSDGTLVKAS